MDASQLARGQDIIEPLRQSCVLRSGPVLHAGARLTGEHRCNNRVAGGKCADIGPPTSPPYLAGPPSDPCRYTLVTPKHIPEAHISAGSWPAIAVAYTAKYWPLVPRVRNTRTRAGVPLSAKHGHVAAAELRTHAPPDQVVVSVDPEPAVRAPRELASVSTEFQLPLTGS